MEDRRAVRDSSRAVTNTPSKFHQSADRWAIRSRSRCTTIRTATLCTRPADRPDLTLAHSTGDTPHPTSRSRVRRASWASTRSWSMSRGLAREARMASWVIS